MLFLRMSREDREEKRRRRRRRYIIYVGSWGTTGAERGKGNGIRRTMDYMTISCIGERKEEEKVGPEKRFEKR